MVSHDDILTAPSLEGAPAVAPSEAALSRVAAELQLRCVRESRRETWFVVNGTSDALKWLPLPLEAGREGTIRRVQVNGEAAAFREVEAHLAIELPFRTLRAGAGTIIVVQYR